MPAIAARSLRLSVAIPRFVFPGIAALNPGYLMCELSKIVQDSRGRLG